MSAGEEKKRGGKWVECPECRGTRGHTTWGADNMDVEFIPCDLCNGKGEIFERRPA